MVRSLSVFVLSGAAAAVGLVACASDDDETKPSQLEQPLSFEESCDTMVSWPRKAELNCQTCISGAKLGCECAREEPWNAKCEALAKARSAEPDCTSQVLDCLALCSDCACKQSCLAGHDACRAKETPLQSCLARTCGTLCR